MTKFKVFVLLIMFRVQYKDRIYHLCITKIIHNNKNGNQERILHSKCLIFFPSINFILKQNILDILSFYKLKE